MLLRRFAVHVRDQNWIAVCLDILVVIVGILIGLQVNDWQGRLESRDREQFLVEQLEQDLEDSLVALDESLAFGRERLVYAMEFGNYLASERNEPPDDLNRMFRLMRGGVGIQVRTGALNELTMEGNLGIVSNNEMRRRIIALADLLRQRQRWSESIIPDVIDDLGSLNAMIGITYDTSLFPDRPSGFDEILDLEQVDIEWQTVKSNPDFRQIVTRHIQRQVYMYSLAQNVRGEIAATLDILNRHSSGE
ncbi:MAG TPA: DUF6090 family protein [Alphaproteobacteria bacterium]|nr:DUF6090 family protein [Alphaproteobacteria bacterium]